ncbi:MAG: DUF4268 domain-containing protein, partial [Bacteroidia bacterium]
MYGKEEASKLRQQFWISFGKYMKPIPSADGLPVNWVNYKTGVKQLFFKMEATQKEAIISIVIAHADKETRLRYFEQFKAFKSMFSVMLGEDWVWEEEVYNEHGIPFSRIYKSIDQVNLFDQTHWPSLITFLKPRMVLLDQFWSD